MKNETYNTWNTITNMYIQMDEYAKYDWQIKHKSIINNQYVYIYDKIEKNHVIWYIIISKNVLKKNTRKISITKNIQKVKYIYIFDNMMNYGKNDYTYIYT